MSFHLKRIAEVCGIDKGDPVLKILEDTGYDSFWAMRQLSSSEGIEEFVQMASAHPSFKPGYKFKLKAMGQKVDEVGEAVFSSKFGFMSKKVSASQIREK